MPSIQSQLMNFTMRNRHLLKFQFKREIWDWNTSIPQFRAECEAGALKAGKLPEGVTVTPVTIDSLPDGLRAEWIRPASSDADNQNDNGVIFYVHGGAFVSGSPRVSSVRTASTRPVRPRASTRPDRKATG